jgi:hypothetical protein
MLRLASVFLISLFLGACATKPGESLSFTGPSAGETGGACTQLHTPEYAVRGKTAIDQAWINKTTEGLVVGCNQPRPQPRPTSFDAPPTTAAVQATTPEPTAEKQIAKRKRWFGF